MRKPIYLEVKPSKGQHPSLEGNEALINKFLKMCSKESLLQFLYEKSAYTKRFEKPSVQERQRKLRYKRNAQKANKDQLTDLVGDKERTRTKKKK